MEIIYNYIKNIVYFSLFVNLILNIFPNKNSKKYVRLFAGFLLILVVLEPIADFDKITQKIEERILEINVLEHYEPNGDGNCIDGVTEDLADGIGELETEIINRIMEQESSDGEN